VAVDRLGTGCPDLCTGVERTQDSKSTSKEMRERMITRAVPGSQNRRSLIHIVNDYHVTSNPFKKINRLRSSILPSFSPPPICNQGVAGSIPAAGTKFYKGQ
jgi:hypothetical protein